MFPSHRAEILQMAVIGIVQVTFRFISFTVMDYVHRISSTVRACIVLNGQNREKKLWILMTMEKHKCSLMLPFRMLTLIAIR